MSRAALAALGLVLSAALPVAALPVAALPAATSSPDVRIFDGEVVKEPVTWIASVGWSKPGNCTASMISPQWVLTATHCVDPGKGLVVAAGKNAWKDAEQVTSASIHSKGDITMVKLAKPYPGVTAVKLPPLGAADPPVGTVADAYGWGLTAPVGSASEVLKHCTVTVTELGAQDNKQGPAFVTQRLSGLPWRGDSGGPLLVNGVQVGVLSMGDTSINTNWYASVAQTRRWIKDVTGV